MKRRSLIVMLVVALLASIAATAVHADSLVYMKEGEVWISHGDGSDARRVTAEPNFWSWPTEDDAGAILVAGGQGGIRPEIEDTPGSEVYRLNQQGAELSAPQETPGSYSTASCPTYPPVSLRVAPDGRHYAYHSWFCDRNIVQIGTVGGQGFTSSDYMSEFVFPYWVSNSTFAISRGGTPLFDSCDPAAGQYQCEWWTHEVGEQLNYGYPWFSDSASSATGFDGIAVSRDGTKFATIEDDGAEWLGAAHNVELRLWSASGAPSAADEEVPAPTFKCQITLPADPQSTLWYYNAGPTFSPDGSRLAFAEPDGVHIANVTNLNFCPSVVAAPLVIPGATQPFWSAADEAANAGYAPPPTGGSPTPGRQGSPSPAPVDRKAPSIAALTISPRRFAVAAASGRSARAQTSGGATIHYSLSEPARVAFDVLQVYPGRRKGKRCVRPTAALRKAPRCLGTIAVGTMTSSGVSGANSMPFSGQVGHRKLKPGSYRLTATPTDAAGNQGASASASFKIVRSGPRNR